MVSSDIISQHIQPPRLKSIIHFDVLLLKSDLRNVQYAERWSVGVFLTRSFYIVHMTYFPGNE